MVFDGTNSPTVVNDMIAGSGGAFPGSDSSSPSDFLVHNNKLYFQAETESAGKELWVYDGTNAPELAYDFRLGPDSSSPTPVYSWNSQLLVVSEGYHFGRELWFMDNSFLSP